MMNAQSRVLPHLTVALLLGAALVLPRAAAVPPGGYPTDPWGDVTGDGIVSQLDVDMLGHYLFTPSTLTPQQVERVKRYGDVAGVVNRSTVGNNTVDVQDTFRHMLLSGGVIDAGTAGTAQPAGGGVYGDVNDDGKVDIADAVLIQRYINGKVTDPAIVAKITARGNGDISPTIPYISFGNGTIEPSDATTIEARATGTEVNPPAYVDYWPLHSPNPDNPGNVADRYTFTDVNGMSGDMNHRISYLTQSPVECRGYTVTEVVGTDNSVVGVFKGIDGSVYALYLQYPYASGFSRVDFQSPVRIIDAHHTLVGDTSGGSVPGYTADLGYRTVPYTVTILANEGVYTPAAGAFPTDSRWSKTLRIRLDIALVAHRAGDVEMQQAFFFDFEPFIGLVSRGQAAVRGAAAPESSKPMCLLDSATVRGITYSPSQP